VANSGIPADKPERIGDPGGVTPAGRLLASTGSPAIGQPSAKKGKKERMTTVQNWMERTNLDIAFVVAGLIAVTLAAFAFLSAYT
jgi:hypothetical protein